MGEAMDRALTSQHCVGPDWLPAWAGQGDRGVYVEWCHAGAQPLREPFFQDSLTRLMRNPINHLLRHRTPMEALAALHRERPGLRPTGFIFHTSRCGSTLISQMLAAVPGNVVLSEPQPIDAILGAVDLESGLPHPMRRDWLAWMLSALGQPRTETDRRLFVKFDAWHASQLPLIREVFPDVPWLFVYRDPREILASHLRQPGAFLVPSTAEGPISPLARVEGTTVAERVVYSVQAACAAVMAALPCREALLVNYCDLPDAMSEEISDHLGLSLNEADREAMAAVTANDAKSPSLPYPHPDEKHPPLAFAHLAIVEEVVMPVYRELEFRRQRSVD